MSTQNNHDEPYPCYWPKANPRKPNALQSRITEQQKRDLYSRTITTKALSELLEVHEGYLSYVFTGKVRILDKKPLIEARKEYKIEVAKDILQGKYSIQQAANIAYVSYNTMQRYLNKAKIRFPELAINYIGITANRRKETLIRTRNV